MQITTGKYHTLLISNSSVYSCGSGLCGVLGQGPETTQCAAFTRIDFPPLARVVHVSASYNHAAFVMQSGEVCSSFTFVHLVMVHDQVISLESKIYFGMVVVSTNIAALRMLGI